MRNPALDSEHFVIETLAEGVFAAIASPDSAAYSNAGIIDLGDTTLVFDTFDAPHAGEDLKHAAETLTGRRTAYVINSHFHADHWLGNQAFDLQTPIIATHRTRELMVEPAAQLKQLQEDPSSLTRELSEVRKRLETECDRNWRVTLELTALRIRHRQESIGSLRARLPNWTFHHDLAFHGTKRQARLLTKGKGHTDSDAYLVLPDDGIVFMGDLGFFRAQPFMVYCDPCAWTAQLQAMERSNNRTFVPGHGPLGKKRDLRLQWEYIAALEEMVADVIKENGTVEHALRRSLPRPFSAWLRGGMGRFEANVRSTFDRLSETG